MVPLIWSPLCFNSDVFADHNEDEELEPVEMKSNKNSVETDMKKQRRTDADDAPKSVTLTAKDQEDQRLKQQLADIEAEMKGLIAQMKWKEFIVSIFLSEGINKYCAYTSPIYIFETLNWNVRLWSTIKKETSIPQTKISKLKMLKEIKYWDLTVGLLFRAYKKFIIHYFW